MAQVCCANTSCSTVSLLSLSPVEAVFDSGGALCAFQVVLAGTRQKLAHGENGDLLHVWHG